MSHLSSNKPQVFPEEDIDIEIRKDKELAKYLKEGKASIESFTRKKYERFDNLMRKKKEITSKRRKEDLD